MFRLERANKFAPVRLTTLIGIIVVPLLIVGGFLGAVWRSADRLHTVQAAVVNNDEMVTVNGQQVPLGRQLTADLVKRRDNNFTWELADTKHAEEGLRDGQYAAVVTIPKEFSAAATSYAGPADQAHQATIRIETSKITGVADGAIAQILADASAQTINRTLTEAYLDNIYVGFNEQGKQMHTVADGAKKLADGGDQLSTGIDQAANGSNELANGMDKLSAGGGQLSSGAKQLSDGSGQLAGGLETMADKTKDLPKQTRQLADGIGAASGGADQLAGGLGQLNGGMPALRSGLGQLSDSTNNELKPGVHAYVDGVNRLVDGLSPVTGPLSQLDPAALDQAQLRQASDQLAGLQSGMKQTANRLQNVSTADCPTTQQPMTPEQRKAFCDGWAQALKQLNTATPGTGGKSPVQWTSDIANSAQLTSAISMTRQTLPQLPDIIKGAQQLGQLKDGGNRLASGVDALADGTKRLSSEGGKLADGVGKLSSGADELAKGLRSAKTGTAALADGMGQLADGISSAATGARKLADGASAYSSGVDQYTSGVSTAAGGARKLSDGMNQMKPGAKDLAKGQRELADGLATGADKIPTYSPMDRLNLKQAVASPIANHTPGDLIPASTATSLLLVLALWVGALATYLVLRAVSARTLTTSESSPRLIWRTLWPGLALGAVQAVALTLVGQVVLHLSAAKTMGILGLLLLGAAVFVVLNHALVAWFGGAGRLISLAMVTLTAATGVISSVPGAFTTVTNFLPLSPILNGVRMILTDGPGLIGAVGLALFWLVLGLSASIAAVLRGRQTSPERLLALAA